VYFVALSRHKFHEIRGFFFQDSDPQMVIYGAVCGHLFENQLYSVPYNAARYGERGSDTPNNLTLQKELWGRSPRNRAILTGSMYFE
jgi:hypothetical protein